MQSSQQRTLQNKGNASKLPISIEASEKGFKKNQEKRLTGFEKGSAGKNTLTQIFKSLATTKETKLERTGFILQLLMFVTAKKETRMFTIFFLSRFCELLSP